MLHDDDYEEEQGEPAKAGTLAHEAAKFWYRRNPETGAWLHTDPGTCFQAAMDSCAAKEFKRGDQVIKHSELPHEATSVQDARTYFDQIIAHYKRDALKVIFSERRYKGSLKNGVPVHLIVDLAVQRDETQPDGSQVKVLEIIDYKTGFIEVTVDEMYDKDQVIMNLLAVRLDPEFQSFNSVRFTYFWVKKGYETGPVAFSDDRLADYEHWLSLEYQRILAIEKPEETMNRFCSSCGRRDKCQKYRKYISDAMQVDHILTPEEMVKIDDEELMARHELLKGQIKTLEALQEGIKAHLEGILTTRQITELEGKNFKAARRSSKHNSHSVQAVLALCLAKGKPPENVLTVKPKAVEQMFNSDPQAMEQLNLTMRRGQTSPALYVNQTGVKKRVVTRKKKEEVQMPAMPLQPIQSEGVPSL